MKRLMNWIVETFYPEHLFWGKRADPFTMFEKVALERGDPLPVLAAYILVDTAIDNQVPEIKVHLKGVTRSGKQSGNWQVTITRIDS